MNSNVKDSVDNEQPLLKNGNISTHTSSVRRPFKKVLLLGYNDVGKSALVTKFVFDYFQENNHNSSIEENYRKTVK